MINRDNFKEVFMRGIKKGKEGIEAATRVYLWARENPQVVSNEWLSEAATLIEDTFGVTPLALVSLIQRFSGKDGMDVGARRIHKFGIGRCAKAVQHLPPRELQAIVPKLDKMEKEEFSKLVEDSRKKDSESAKRLSAKSKRQKEKHRSEDDPREEVNRLRTEIRIVKAERDEERRKREAAEARAAELESKLRAIQGALQKV